MVGMSICDAVCQETTLMAYVQFAYLLLCRLFVSPKPHKT